MGVISDTKRVSYAELVERVLRNPWFAGIKHLKRKEITTLNRLHSGHCLSPVHLLKIGVKPDPLCTCNQRGTIQHLLFECPHSILERD